MQAVTLVFPNQLFKSHPAINAERTTILYEEPLIFGNDSRWQISPHKKRLVLYRASMRAYHEKLIEQGYSVQSICNTGDHLRKPFELLEKLLEVKSLQQIHLVKLTDRNDV